MLNDNIKYKKWISDEEYLNNGTDWCQNEIYSRQEEQGNSYTEKSTKKYIIKKLKSFGILQEDIELIINKLDFARKEIT